MKKLLGALIVLILFMMTVLLGAHFFLGYIAKFALEKSLPQLTRTPVTVHSVHLSPLFGRAELRGLAVANPDGFSSEHVLNLAELRVALQPRTLWQSTIIIDRIEIVGAQFTLEGRGSQQNLTVLLENIQQRTQPRRRPTPKPEEEETAATDRFIIRELIIDQSSVRMMMGGVPLAMQLQRMEFQNVKAGARGSGELDIQAILHSILSNNPPS